MNLFNQKSTEEDVNLTPTEKKRENLLHRKKGLDTNRNLSGFVFLLLGYYVYKGQKENAPIWLYIILVILMIIAAFIAWSDTKNIKKVQSSIDELELQINSEANATTEESENTDNEGN